MLLAGDTDGGDTRPLRQVQPGKARADRVDPPFGSLFAAAVVVGDQLQRMAMAGDDLARLRVIGDQLDALGAYIESEEQAHASLPAGAGRSLPSRRKAGTTAIWAK